MWGSYFKYATRPSNVLGMIFSVIAIANILQRFLEVGIGGMFADVIYFYRRFVDYIHVKIVHILPEWVPTPPVLLVDIAIVYLIFVGIIFRTAAIVKFAISKDKGLYSENWQKDLELSNGSLSSKIKKASSLFVKKGEITEKGERKIKFSSNDLSSFSIVYIFILAIFLPLYLIMKINNGFYVSSLITVRRYVKEIDWSQDRSCKIDEKEKWFNRKNYQENNYRTKTIVEESESDPERGGSYFSILIIQMLTAIIFAIAGLVWAAYSYQN